jgi:hypothetical protein
VHVCACSISEIGSDSRGTRVGLCICACMFVYIREIGRVWAYVPACICMFVPDLLECETRDIQHMHACMCMRILLIPCRCIQRKSKTMATVTTDSRSHCAHLGYTYPHAHYVHARMHTDSMSLYSQEERRPCCQWRQRRATGNHIALAHGTWQERQYRYTG